jgi:hypothetical protein
MVLDLHTENKVSAKDWMRGSANDVPSSLVAPVGLLNEGLRIEGRE